MRGLALLLLASAGCYDVSGLNGVPVMLPGQDCMRCHNANGAAYGHQFTVAGTVFPDLKSQVGDGVQGAEVLIVDKVGTKLTLLTNESGNFYTSEVLVPPIHVDVQLGNHRMRMVEPPPAPDGGLTTPISCNLCHTYPTPGQAPVAGFSPAPGRVFVPVDTPAAKP
ncbi:MAG: hypothetical protein ACYDCL_06335 [Myxococcales bacterium]